MQTFLNVVKCKWKNINNFFVPGDFMEEVVPIIKKLWHEGGNNKFLLKQVRNKQYV